MTASAKRWLILSILAAVVGGVALAAYELSILRQAVSLAESVADSVAAGLGGTAADRSVTVSVSLLLGLIPVGPVKNPYLVIAVGDFFLGALISGAAILLAFSGIATFRRSRIVKNA